MPEKYLFFNDWLLLVRLLFALSWGVGLAFFLQRTKLGQYLAVERTWITVVVGVGIDWLIAAGMDLYTWLVMGGIIAASAFGIIIRSIRNEHKKARKNGRNPIHYNNMVNSLDEASAMAMDLNNAVLRLLRDSQELKREDILAIKDIIATSTTLQIKVTDARKGEYHPIRNGARK